MTDPSGLYNVVPSPPTWGQARAVPPTRTKRRLTHHEAALVKTALSAGCSPASIAYALNAPERTIRLIQNGTHFADIRPAPLDTQGADAPYWQRLIEHRAAAHDTALHVLPGDFIELPSAPDETRASAAGRLIGALVVAAGLLAAVAATFVWTAP